MGQSLDFTLMSISNQRKYVIPEECKKFATFARMEERDTRSFCLMLKETGMRMSEALNLRVRHIDLSSRNIVVETLKKKRKGIFRQIPLSDSFLEELNLVHNLRCKQRTIKGQNEKMWGFTRRTGHRRIQKVMDRAEIFGEQANSHGLRHAFGIACAINEIPLPIIQKWMGHASIETTAIYLDVRGEEERIFASRIWIRDKIQTTT